ncbi:hypothetical protein ASE71_16290 [Ensifer sp. Root954]|nr:hypothetical protein ASE71_16290 [Ensifer sp. Root954]
MLARYPPDQAVRNQMSIHMRDLGEAVLDLLYWRPTEQAPELNDDRHLLIQAYRTNQAPEAARQEHLTIDPELAVYGRSNP